jgi:hypothetical protein
MEELENTPIGINDTLVSWRVIDKQVIVLNKKERVFYELNNTAVFIWLKVAKGATVKGLIKSVIEKFDTTPTIARKDITAYINEAVKKKIFILK